MRAAQHIAPRCAGTVPLVDDITTPGGVRVDGAGLRFEFARSGGPGGQHVNTSASKVTVVLDVDAGLPPELAARVRERHGATVRATSSEFRSQWRNRKAALDRLATRIDELVTDEPTRVDTKVPARERSRRRADKARRSRRLADRRVKGEED
jgi:ribosome-associated protein